MPRAAVCHAFDAPLAVEEVLLAEPGPGEMRVRLEACAICHSDVSLADGAWGGMLPAVYGHEAVGVVERAGDGVELEPGARVVVGLVRHCGACARCADGEPALCEAVFPLDERSPISFPDDGPVSQGLRVGAFAEEVVIHESQAVQVPTSLPAASAAVLGCAVLTGYGAAVHTARVRPGS